MTSAAELIRARLRDKGLRPSPVAKQLGVSKATMSRIVNGKQNVSKEMLPKLAVLLDIAPADLRPDLADFARIFIAEDAE